MSSSLPTIDAPQAPSPGAALRIYALSELERCLVQLARQGEARHTGIHQARKSLRRARATLALAQGRLGAKAEKLDRRLRRLCRSLCQLRDSHAVLGSLKRWTAELEPARRKALRPALSAARQALKAQRDQMLEARLQSEPELHRLRDKLLACLDRVDSLPWERVQDKHIEAALGRSHQRIARAMRRAEARNRIEDFHRWRRRLRRLRQQLTALQLGGLRGEEDPPPVFAQLDALAWRQDLDVLVQAVSGLSGMDPAQRHQLSLALRPDSAVESSSSVPE